MRAPSLLRSAWAVVLLGLFQGATSAQCPNRGSVVVEEVSNTLGKPYEAREITTIVNFAKDGAKEVVLTKASLFRDSRGRLRVERLYDGDRHPPRKFQSRF